MTTTAEHIAARDDQDIQARLIATAEIRGVLNARAWVGQHLAELVSTGVVVNGENTSVTATYAYAAAVREEYLADERALPPGKNPGAVTDPILLAAVEAVLEPVPEEPQVIPPIDVEDVPST